MPGLSASLSDGEISKSEITEDKIKHSAQYEQGRIWRQFEKSKLASDAHETMKSMTKQIVMGEDFDDEIRNAYSQVKYISEGHFIDGDGSRLGPEDKLSQLSAILCMYDKACGGKGYLTTAQQILKKRMEEEEPVVETDVFDENNYTIPTGRSWTDNEADGSTDSTVKLSKDGVNFLLEVNSDGEITTTSDTNTTSDMKYTLTVSGTTITIDEEPINKETTVSVNTSNLTFTTTDQTQHIATIQKEGNTINKKTMIIGSTSTEIPDTATDEANAITIDDRKVRIDTDMKVQVKYKGTIPTSGDTTADFELQVEYTDTNGDTQTTTTGSNTLTVQKETPPDTEAPEFTAESSISPATIKGDPVKIGKVSDNVSDASNLSIVSQPTDGNITIDSDGKVRYKTIGGSAENRTVSFKVKDEAGKETTCTVTVTVEAEETTTKPTVEKHIRDNLLANNLINKPDGTYYKSISAPTSGTIDHVIITDQNNQTHKIHLNNDLTLQDTEVTLKNADGSDSKTYTISIDDGGKPNDYTDDALMFTEKMTTTINESFIENIAGNTAHYELKEGNDVIGETIDIGDCKADVCINQNNNSDYFTGSSDYGATFDQSAREGDNPNKTIVAIIPGAQAKNGSETGGTVGTGAGPLRTSKEDGNIITKNNIGSAEHSNSHGRMGTDTDGNITFGRISSHAEETTFDYSQYDDFLYFPDYAEGGAMSSNKKLLVQTKDGEKRLVHITDASKTNTNEIFDSFGGAGNIKYAHWLDSGTFDNGYYVDGSNDKQRFDTGETGNEYNNVIILYK